MELFRAHHAWSTRPADERFHSLDAMLSKMNLLRSQSKEQIAAVRDLTIAPVPGDNRGLVMRTPRGAEYAPSNWAFSQLAQIAGATTGYMKKLPTPLAADCMNYGLQFLAEAGQESGLLLNRNLDGELNLRAATGPQYGRIWNADVVRAIMDKFGNGTGRDGSNWSVPGYFGKPVEEINDDTTTLYAGDRDMFVFLADEQNRIDVPNRREGRTGSLARGVFFWNSEVGSATFGMAHFLFDYMCLNHIVWGATEYKQIKIRHSSGAPSRFIEEVQPALQAYAAGSTAKLTQVIADAQARRCDANGGDVADFLANRFGPRLVSALQAIHEAEEGKPITTLFDAVTAATAYARNIPNMSDRVAMETTAGKLLDLVS